MCDPLADESAYTKRDISRPFYGTINKRGTKARRFNWAPFYNGADDSTRCYLSIQNGDHLEERSRVCCCFLFVGIILVYSFYFVGFGGCIEVGGEIVFYSLHLWFSFTCVLEGGDRKSVV